MVDPRGPFLDARRSTRDLARPPNPTPPSWRERVVFGTDREVPGDPSPSGRRPFRSPRLGSQDPLGDVCSRPKGTVRLMSGMGLSSDSGVAVCRCTESGSPRSWVVCAPVALIQFLKLYPLIGPRRPPRVIPVFSGRSSHRCRGPGYVCRTHQCRDWVR